MHPYREPPPVAEPDDRMPHEEKVLVGMLVGLGLLRILPAFATGEPIGSEPTVALIGFVGGMWWGLRWYRRSRRARAQLIR